MEVTLAKTAGFCFGVRRAVDKVYELADTEDKVYTYGPIIHNEEVVSDLEAKGVTVLHSLEELATVKDGIVVIRSHGVPEKVYRLLEEKQIRYADATCPYVRKIHKLVEKHSAAGRRIVIVGNDHHPEVEGIKGWSQTDPFVIGSVEEAVNFELPEGTPICVVSQTTFNYNKFKDIVEILDKKRYDRLVLNTICSATEERQTEAVELASRVDAMIVIGGRSSSNTQKLFEICRHACENTYYIQTLVDLDIKPFQSFRHVGITAGASTPNKIIEEVQRYVRIKL
ncbi:MAG: 4-hydroxy-3-methylbut-2-enyl diphosphate reductase [Lachnospiraceae bacterium]